MDENHTSYHVKETIAIRTTFNDEDIEVRDYYNHTKISGPKAEAFVNRFCGGQEGDFKAKVLKSPLLDEAEHYVYSIK